MAEYIRREDVLFIINASCFDLEYNSENIALQEEIKLIPAADVRPVVHGQWITRPYMMANTEYCSCCGENYGRKHNFCPNCGADMRGEDDG